MKLRNELREIKEFKIEYELQKMDTQRRLFEHEQIMMQHKRDVYSETKLMQLQNEDYKINVQQLVHVKQKYSNLKQQQYNLTKQKRNKKCSQQSN